MFIQPTWSAPKHIKAYTTLRTGGVSQTPYDDFNLAQHVGDDCQHVSANRDLLKQKIQLPDEPIWLEQTHSTHVLKAIPANRDQNADASFTNDKNQVCAILTADCLPVLLTNTTGTHVAAIHAGWRGLLNGIIESTIASLNLSNDTLLAWLGPAISAANYEVGSEVREQFITHDPEAIHAFLPSPRNAWLADLYALARMRLSKQGVTAIYGGDFCTFGDKKRFFSYRRDGSQTGRMATLIWISDTISKSS